MMRFQHAIVVLAIALARASASIMPPQKDDQCAGLMIDFDRLQNVGLGDLDPVSRSLGGRSYGVTSVNSVTKRNFITSSDECVARRHRLHETLNGVKVYGANVIVTANICENDNTAAGSFGGGYTQSPLETLPLNTIADIHGKTFSSLGEATGTYVPSQTEETTISALASHFDTTTEKIGELELTIFPSYERGDLLSYRSEVWVSKDNDHQLFDVIVSAVTGEIYSICNKVNQSKGVARVRKLRERRQLQEFGGANHGSSFESSTETSQMCGSCASQDLVEWTQEETSCDINTLYLDDTGRTTTCLKGTLNGQEVLGPGIVSSLHYYGSYDCNQRETGCNANILPTDCKDSLSDVHYGVTQTMQFMKDYLGVEGGLNINGAEPIKTASFVHFAYAYCNAFFTTQTNSLYFGDCDCQFWTPLTSIDVTAHELAHGITNYASGLVYAYQPGGLNEGYSDIVGATMEYMINDVSDTPDYMLGENLIGDGSLEGFILRYMSDPTKDGKSIANVCDFTNDMNVHYTSGVPNLAFVSTVNACKNNGCATERECVQTLGPLYMYANINGLTQLSGYLDAATATCNLSDEYLARGKAHGSCSNDAIADFIKTGWAAVGVTLDGGCAAKTSSGCVLPGIPSDAGGGGIGCFKDVADWTVDAVVRSAAWTGEAVGAAFGWMLSPFFGRGDDAEEEGGEA